MTQNKTIGLVAGVSPKITKFHIEQLNIKVAEKFGEECTPRIIVKSFNYSLTSRLRTEEKWGELSKIFLEGAFKLQEAGAEVIMYSTDIANYLLNENIRNVNVKIVDPISNVIQEIKSKGIKRVSVLGSKHMMKSRLYSDIEEKYDVKVFSPDEDEKKFIHNNIFRDLSYDIISVEARKKYSDIIENLKERHAVEAIVLGNHHLNFILSKDRVKNDIIVIDNIDLKINKVIELAQFN